MKKLEEIKINGHLAGYKITISLTGPDSHKFDLYFGEGHFSIGAKGIKNNGINKVMVDKDDVINWQSIDEACPWKPMAIYYTGNDTGFLKWAKEREIFNFSWTPLKKMKVDFSQTKIQSLFFYLDYELEISLGDNIYTLDLYGNPNNLKILKCSKVPDLSFHFRKDKNIKKHTLPEYLPFKDVKKIYIELNANDVPFDCSSLLQFKNLKVLYLDGNLTNLNSLKELTSIEELGFWNVPDLSNLPPLETFKNLRNFVAQNIDAKTGEKLRKELKELKKVKKFDFASVSKLRDKLWFITEYGLPFVNWEEELSKKATRTYKVCLNKIKIAENESEVKNAVVEFINKMNALDDIETQERDDICDALNIAIKNTKIEIKTKKLFEWIEETREF